MFKKVFLVLVVALTILAIPLNSVSAAENAKAVFPCGHSFGKREAPPETYYYRAVDYKSHAYCYYTYDICMECGYVLSDIYEKIVSITNHQFIFEDLGHSGVRHIYRDICYPCG